MKMSTSLLVFQYLNTFVHILKMLGVFETNYLVPKLHS